MKKTIVLFVFSFLMITISCKKHLGDKPVTPAPAPALTRDNWLAGLNKEIASILEEVYKNDSAYREVNAAIFSEYYTDERVLLKDLLFPETSNLYATENFRKFNAPAGVFKRIFNGVMKQGAYPLLKEALSKETDTAIIAKTGTLADNVTLAGTAPGVFSGETAAAIYFPYSVNFGTTGTSGSVSIENIQHATIVAADREANSAPGTAPYACTADGKTICYKDVLVDDDYANSQPVHIVENGARPKPVSIGIGDTVQLPNPTTTTRVYLGWAKLTRQMDALISFTGNGGGSEIKVARLSGYLVKKDEQVTSFAGDMVSVDYSRGDIRNQRWKRVYSIWDPNWNKEDLEQVFAVYEDDTKGEKTFTGSLSTTVTLGEKPLGAKAEGSVSYKVAVITQDDIITQRKMDRNSFFNVGMNNQGWGYMPDVADFLTVGKDWPIYDGGTIWQFTMPWKIN